MSYKDKVAEAVTMIEEHNKASGFVLIDTDQFRSGLRRIGATTEASLPFCSIKDLMEECGLPSIIAARLVAIFGLEVEKYKLKRLIAEGGFGHTYLAEHMLTGKLVCIKDCGETGPEAEAVLINEIKVMWDLRHFAIPQVRDLIRMSDGRLAMVMSYIPGLTLRQVVEKVGPLDAEHVAWITERVLNALLYLRDNSVVHGDVKPQNIIVQKDHTAVLVDYGLSVLKPTRTSSSAGFTEVFSPPEQTVANGGPLLPESDLYSLGMTMIYALTGDIKLTKQKRVPEDTPEPLCNFIRRLIVHDVNHRPRWEDEDLFDTFKKVRLESFKRRRSGMKPIPGLD